MTPLERELAQAHRQLQMRLAGATTVQLLDLWPLFNPDSPAAWLAAATRLITEQRGVSAGVARNYIRSTRRRVVGASPTGTIPRPGVPTEAIRTSFVVTGPVRIERARRRGLDVQSAIRTAQAETSRAGARHVLNAGRETITDYTRTDRRAGWVRVTSGNSCDFCSMLAGRGAVYGATSVGFEAHDGCNCAGALTFR